MCLHAKATVRSPIWDCCCLSAGLEATYSRCLLGLLLLSWSSLLPKWVFSVLAPRELMEDLQTNISVESTAVLAIFVQTLNHMGSLCALAGCRPITSWRSRPSGTGGPALKPACAAVRFCHAGAILAGPGCVQSCTTCLGDPYLDIIETQLPK